MTLLVLLLLTYFLPSAVARLRGHRSVNAIFLVDLFFGWTFLGWFIALVWSATGNVDPKTRPGRNYTLVALGGGAALLLVGMCFDATHSTRAAAVDSETATNPATVGQAVNSNRVYHSTPATTVAATPDVGGVHGETKQNIQTPIQMEIQARQDAAIYKANIKSGKWKEFKNGE